MKNTTNFVQKKSTPNKKHYQKPLIQNFGSVVQLTAGTTGSTTDVSDPFGGKPI